MFHYFDHECLFQLRTFVFVDVISIKYNIIRTEKSKWYLALVPILINLSIVNY